MILFRLGILLSLVIPVQLLQGQGEEPFQSDILVGPTPWTNLDFYNNPQHFQFAIVSDRTGGLRPGVFADAVKKINWMMPEFVMSVGDFIPGVTLDEQLMDKEWAEFESVIQPLKVPFFFLPGNHDISNDLMRQKWVDKFGKAYYYYVYKDVLFLALDTNPEDAITISPAQIDYFKGVLADHQNVRWTFVFMHHPLWTYGEYAGGFTQIEALLKGRKHTVIAGHNHRYVFEKRDQTNYYILATTGGGSGLRGPQFGEFDHLTWVTMTEEGPQMANLRLSGILPHDVTQMENLQLAKQLIESVDFDHTVLMNQGTDFTAGKIKLSFQNTASHELSIDARFFHGHDLQIKPMNLAETIAPGATKSFFFEIRPLRSRKLFQLTPLQLDWTIGLQIPNANNFVLSGTRTIEMVPSSLNTVLTINPVFADSLKIALQNPLETGHLHYTLNGDTPGPNSARYKNPFHIHRSANLKTVVIDGAVQSAISEKSYQKIEQGRGLPFRYYEGKWRKMPDFSQLKPINEGVIDHFEVSQLKMQDDHFGLVLNGQIHIPLSGEYTFYTTSDDGSLLFIDDQLVVDNDGDHGPMTRSGNIELKKGMHTFKVKYFENIGGELLEVEVSGPGMERQHLPWAWLGY